MYVLLPEERLLSEIWQDGTWSSPFCLSLSWLPGKTPKSSKKGKQAKYTKKPTKTETICLPRLRILGVVLRLDLGHLGHLGHLGLGHLDLGHLDDLFGLATPVLGGFELRPTRRSCCWCKTVQTVQRRLHARRRIVASCFFVSQSQGRSTGHAPILRQGDEYLLSILLIKQIYLLN